jgi:hypothetical protein
VSVFHRPDFFGSPDCEGNSDCDGKTHQCPVFGLPGMCQWPVSITMKNFDKPFWDTKIEAGLAERWLGDAV